MSETRTWIHGAAKLTLVGGQASPLPVGELERVQVVRVLAVLDHAAEGDEARGLRVHGQAVGSTAGRHVALDVRNKPLIGGRVEHVQLVYDALVAAAEHDHEVFEGDGAVAVARSWRGSHRHVHFLPFEVGIDVGMIGNESGTAIDATGRVHLMWYRHI